MRFLVNAWKIGREFEDIIDQTEAQLMQQAQQAMNTPPQPSEKQIIENQRSQTELTKEQMKQQGKLADIQSKEKMEFAKLQMENLNAEERNKLKEGLALLDADLKVAEKMMQ